jgi:hypothetical protein
VAGYTLILSSFKSCPVLMQADCLAAIALQLLLKVKRHLKIVYSLNDSRCQVKLHTVGFCHDLTAMLMFNLDEL